MTIIQLLFLLGNLKQACSVVSIEVADWVTIILLCFPAALLGNTETRSTYCWRESCVGLVRTRETWLLHSWISWDRSWTLTQWQVDPLFCFFAYSFKIILYRQISVLCCQHKIEHILTFPRSLNSNVMSPLFFEFYVLSPKPHEYLFEMRSLGLYWVLS